MARSTVHYADSATNNTLKRLHNKLRPAGTPVERVEYIIELLLLRIFEAKLKQEESFVPLRSLFSGENYRLLFSHLISLSGEQILSELNKNIFPFYSTILSKARPVVGGNLPQKMQDQLVLMEEVFSNSNFTNNVKGGVISEVIGMVNEIEERYILKTDLLGDAIESALSETGGTKDLGLYRTPDHIRRMMVEMVDPDFSDTIFDPACGTAGFLFDAYDFVIEKARKTRKFPPENVANMFYRTGIAGIEYQGRIRKMAAVNMYIRGLNPHNIEQGDSLKLYDPSKDAGSKSVVIANPPFGAERDQPAYPNVWEDYSKESETTILFVKLMFDLLAHKGRCAVVVSEGFLTWGQGSACALRKMLLNETNLRAVISLPQGVFVSKSGQGAKTSILYFEKGEPTDFVWYCKIENDGLSMGTNRKSIEGSHIPELLKLFAEVKQGKRPQDTNRSFCIDREQIETLDPRIAERIRREVTDKMIERNTAKREKLIVRLKEKMKTKRISKALYDEQLWQFDNALENQTANEIVKAIEKAHSYHFNLQNYRSNLSEDQVKEWRETLKGVEIKNGSKIEKRYQELQSVEPKLAVQILASFDPHDVLQMDIAREYLSKLDKKVLEKEEKMAKLFEILKETKQYSNVPLSSLMRVKREVLKLDDYKHDFDIVEKIRFADGKIFLRNDRETKINLQFCDKDELIISKINFHQGAVSINTIGKILCSLDYLVYEVNKEKVNPQFLFLLLKDKNFLTLVEDNKPGGVKGRSQSDFIETLQIPLPPLEVQNEIVEKIEKQKQIIEGAERIESGWKLDISFAPNVYEKVEIGILVESSMYGTSNKAEYQESGYPVLRIGNIGFCNFDLSDIKNVELESKEFEKLKLNKGDFLIVRSNGNPDLVGKCAVWDKDETYVYASYLIRFIFDTNKIIPRYAMYYFMSPEGRVELTPKQGGGTYNINSEEFRKFPIPLPPLETQRQIVEKLDKQMQALEGVRLLKSEAQQRIEEIVAGVWGK